MSTPTQEQPSPAQPPPPPPPPDPTPPIHDSKKPPLPPPEPDFVTVPSHSRLSLSPLSTFFIFFFDNLKCELIVIIAGWFTWEGIHECEAKQVPEFFDGKLPQSKNPNLYKYIRNSIIKKFRSNPSKKLTFTEARRNIVGDVGSIRRVFDFLDTWGLINYSPSSSKWPLKWEDREGKTSSSSTAASTAPSPPTGGSANGTESAGNVERNKKWCSACKTVCSIACFVSDKYDLVLCARCYVRGNYRVGLSSNEFRRVEISEPSKEWTDKETLQLLESVMHYGDDWKSVTEHVSGRTEKECVARFIKLPFGEQFVEPGDHCEEESIDYENKDQTNGESENELSTKRRNITPLADASNPIMAQAAFLSALAGVEVSEAAAQAAVATLYNMHHLARNGSVQPQVPTREHANGDSSFSAVEKVCAEQESFLKQEEDEFVASISTITEVQMKEMLDKITHFEQMHLQLDKEWHQVHQMKHQHFLDQLTLLFHKATAPKSVENFAKEENVRT